MTTTVLIAMAQLLVRLTRRPALRCRASSARPAVDVACEIRVQGDAIRGGRIDLPIVVHICKTSHTDLRDCARIPAAEQYGMEHKDDLVVGDELRSTARYRP